MTAAVVASLKVIPSQPVARTARSRQARALQRHPLPREAQQALRHYGLSSRNISSRPNVQGRARALSTNVLGGLAEGLRMANVWGARSGSLRVGCARREGVAQLPQMQQVVLGSD